MEPETQNYMVKAVVSLLQEATPYGSRMFFKTHQHTVCAQMF